MTTGDIPHRFTGREQPRDPAVAPRQRRQPGPEVDPQRGDVGGCGMAVFDEQLIPLALLLVPARQALYRHTRAEVAIQGRDIVAIQSRRDTAPSPIALDRKNSQRCGKGAVPLTPCDEPGKRDKTAGHNFLFGFLALHCRKMTEAEPRIAADDWQQPFERGIAGGNAAIERGSWRL